MGSVPTVVELVSGQLVACAEVLVTIITWKWFLGERRDSQSGEEMMNIW